MNRAECPKANCGRCPRLAAARRQTLRDRPDYWARPVPAWGPAESERLLVGLAPGFHGAHRTGLPFCGDDSGNTLFAVMAALNQLDEQGAPHSLRITNAVKCWPPQNKPTGHEINRCNTFLQAELAGAKRVMVLGGVAHRAVIKALGLSQRDYPFAHDARAQLPEGRQLFSSYHCSRYNLNTGRISHAMLKTVMERFLA